MDSGNWAYPTNIADVQYVCGTVRVPPALTFFRSWMTENVRKTGVREVFADQHGGASTRFGISMAMDADDEDGRSSEQCWCIDDDCFYYFQK